MILLKVSVFVMLVFVSSWFWFQLNNLAASELWWMVCRANHTSLYRHRHTCTYNKLCLSSFRTRLLSHDALVQRSLFIIHSNSAPHLLLRNMSQKPKHLSLLMASLVIVLPTLLSSAESKTYWGDVAALKDLKNLVDVKSMSPGSCLSTWDFSVDPCDSVFSDKFTCGLRCVSGRVTELSFDQAGYSGSISSFSFNLPYLQTLDLTGNYFSGPLPDSLSNVTRLTRLAVSGNSFSGSIPDSLGSMSLLEELLLDSNRLDGSVPGSFNGLSSLKRLEIQVNNISGEFPDLSSLKNLYYLDASDNRISGRIPSSLPESLVQISMRNNLIHGTIPQSFILFNSLQVIDLTHNKLSGSIPSFIFTHQSLQQLTLSFNGFTLLFPLESPQRAHIHRSQQQSDPRRITSVLGSITQALSFVLREQQLLWYDSDPIRLENRIARIRIRRVPETLTRREFLIRSRTGSFDGAEAWLSERPARRKLLLVVPGDLVLLPRARAEISYGMQKV